MADIIARCEARRLRMTDQRRVLARLIGAAVCRTVKTSRPGFGLTGHRLDLLAVSLRK